MANMQLGEVVFGGVGSGFYGMIVVRRAHGLHRGPHGRPDAGVSRQEDRAARGAVRDPRGARGPGLRARSGRGSRQSSRRRSRRSTTRGRTDSARSSTPSRRARTTTAAPSPDSAATRSGTCRWAVVMLFGRLAIVVPVLALAGGSRGQARGRDDGRHVHDDVADLRRAADRRDRHRRRADVPPGGRPRADRRALPHAARTHVLMVSHSRSLFDRSIVVPAIASSFAKLDPRVQARNPVMFVVEIAALVTLLFAFEDAAQGRRGLRRRDLASGSGSPCSSRTSPRPSPKAGARRKRSSCGAPSPTPSRASSARQARNARRRVELAQRRPHRRRGERDHRDRRRDRRRRGDRRRVGDHGRVGARRARGGRRSQQRHGRHARALGPHRRRRRHGSGRVVPRSHDLARRGRAASEDAQRDRALDPALGAHPDLRRRGRDARAVLDLRGQRSRASSSSSRCSSASFRRRSAACSRRSASRAWIACCSATCSP